MISSDSPGLSGGNQVDGLPRAQHDVGTPGENWPEPIEAPWGQKCKIDGQILHGFPELTDQGFLYICSLLLG